MRLISVLYAHYSWRTVFVYREFSSRFNHIPQQNRKTPLQVATDNNKSEVIKILQLGSNATNHDFVSTILYFEF
jgi:hypothetical protein